MMILLVTVLFVTTLGTMYLLFPELIRKPREAAISGLILIFAYGLSLLQVMNKLPFTIDELLSGLFSLLSPTRYLK